MASKRTEEDFMIDYVKFISKVEAAKRGEENSEEDKKRLRERLELFGFQERPTKADGSCQFSAVSDQLFHDDSHAWELRQKAVAWLRRNPLWNPSSQLHGEYVLYFYSSIYFF